MKKRLIPRSIINGRETYQQHVIEEGHLPGVLSGAELKGKAKDWSSSYKRSRQGVGAKLNRYGIYSTLIGGKRVWAEGDLTPVRLYLVDFDPGDIRSVTRFIRARVESLRPTRGDQAEEIVREELADLFT